MIATCWPQPPDGVRWVVAGDYEDPDVAVSFGSATYTAVEGSEVTVLVSLNQDPKRSLTILLTTANQGTSNTDYSGVPQSVTFDSGEIVQTFLFKATQDSEEDEEGESVLFSFGSPLPTGVTAGGTFTTVVTIEAPVNPIPRRIIAPSGGGGGGGGPPPVPVPSDADFDWNVTRDIDELDRDNDIPTGIWSDGKTLWIVENSSSGADRVFAYDLETGERQQDAEFELESRNRFSHGLWSDREIAWIADSGQDKLFAYDLSSGERLEARDIELAERNRDPRGIWSDRKTLFVLDSVKDALFVYDFETGELLAEYPFDKLNKSPRGIWSDGVTIWVSDDGAKRLFAYRIEDGSLVRHEDEEFTFRSLLKAGNGSPRGIWSDGDVIYVVDEQDDKVYTYNLPDAIIAQLASLRLSDLELEEFSPNRFEYAGAVAHDLAATTVAVEATQEAAGVKIEPADADGDPENGHQVTLATETSITVTVMSADGSRTKTYTDSGEQASVPERTDRGASERSRVRRRQHQRAGSLRAQLRSECALPSR